MKTKPLTRAVYMRRFGAPMDPAMSIALSDAQIAQILLVSRPLQPKERTAFMAALLEDLLMRRDEIGDGELGRLLRDLQRKHFRPPTDEESGSGNYGARWPQRLRRISR
jgi:hypothetical protein